jgi:hypothetical protein
VIAILIVIGFTFRYIYEYRESYYIIIRVYNILEYSLLAYYFSLHIKNNLIKNILLFSTIPFTLFCIFNFIAAKEPAIPFIPVIVEYILLLSFIIYFFFEVMQESIVDPIYQKVIFWVSVAFIINFSGNFFLFLYSKNSFNNEEFQRQYTIIYSTVTILKNLLLCIAVMIKERKIENDSLFPDDTQVELGSFHPFKDLN